MTSLIFCLFAVVLFFIGHRLVKKGTAFTRKGGDEYTKKRRRKTIGQTLWVVGGLFLVLALINLFYQDAISTTDVASANSAIKSQAHPASTPPQPPSSFAGRPDSAFPPRVDNLLHPQNMPEIPTPAPAPAPSPPPAENPMVKTPALENPPPTDAPWTPPHPPTGQHITSNRQTELDNELQAANAVLQKNPSSLEGYIRRGNVYGQEKQWDQAAREYKSALALDGKNSWALFNLAELDFLQQRYDAARIGFITLQKDSEVGDLATYKVFLCDLAGGHEDAAAKELDVFNQVGSNASYYFANVAWSASHQKPEDARQWLASALKIFSPRKVNQYVTSLVDLGYMPPQLAQ